MKTEITLTASTKAAVEEKAAELVAAVQGGDVDALQAWVYLIALESVSKNAKKGIEAAALNAASMYGQKSFNAFGAGVTLKEMGVRYDYSDCGDKEWEALTDKINELTEKRKELEKVLLAHKEKWVKTDMETGETYEVLPPIKLGKESLSIQLK